MVVSLTPLKRWMPSTTEASTSLMLELNWVCSVRRVHLVVEAVEALPLLGGDFFADLAGIFARGIHAIGDGGGVMLVEDQLVGH